MIFSFFPSFLFAIPLFSPPPYTKQYNIFNNCPSDINLYVGGVLDGNIASGGNVTRFLDTGEALFYTDANGGNANGAGTTRAGFFGNVGIHQLEFSLRPSDISSGLVLHGQRHGAYQHGPADKACRSFFRKSLSRKK